MQTSNNLSALLTIIDIAEYLTLFAAIFLLNKKRVGIWRLFILLLLIIVWSETFGWFWNFVLIKKHNFHKPNAWIFNVNMIFTDTFLLSILTTAKHLNKTKKIICISIAAFLLSALINLFFFEGFWEYNKFTETAGDIMQVIVCCYVFYCFIIEETYRDLLANEYFWLATGILFSSMGSAFLYNFPTVLGKFQQYTKISLFTTINTVLNILLYVSMIIAFICRNRNTKSL